ncbi:MAG: hypothetical protein O7B24_07535, partial [Alphaproteobacteria bacterium]|nr:hypothetical protein [Alphaproteobacteria bacterium]
PDPISTDHDARLEANWPAAQSALKPGSCAAPPNIGATTPNDRATADGRRAGASYGRTNARARECRSSRGGAGNVKTTDTGTTTSHTAFGARRCDCRSSARPNRRANGRGQNRCTRPTRGHIRSRAPDTRTPAEGA